MDVISFWVAVLPVSCEEDPFVFPNKLDESSVAKVVGVARPMDVDPDRVRNKLEKLGRGRRAQEIIGNSLVWLYHPV